MSTILLAGRRIEGRGGAPLRGPAEQPPSQRDDPGQGPGAEDRGDEAAPAVGLGGEEDVADGERQIGQGGYGEDRDRAPYSRCRATIAPFDLPALLAAQVLQIDGASG